MRVAFFALVFTFVTRARGAPSCVCELGKVIDSTGPGGDIFGARLSGGPSAEWQFPDCKAPNSASVNCLHGTNIGTAGNRPTGRFDVPGVINTQCVIEGVDGGTLKEASIRTALSNAQDTANLAGISRSDYPAETRDPTGESACCGECDHGYRLQEVFQAPAGGGTEVLVGYICVEQFCANGKTDFSDPNNIFCECTSTHFRSDWSVTNLASSTANPSIITAATTPVPINTVEQQGVRSTGAQFGNYLGQANCITYDSNAHCFAPDNCLTIKDCSSNGQQYATLCETCENGYNLKNVKCDSLGGTPVEFSGSNVKNKCQVCELASSGCAHGHVSPG